VIGTFLVEGGLLLVLLVVTALIGIGTRRRKPRPGQSLLGPWVPAADRAGTPVSARWGLAGLGTPVVVMLAWLLAGGFAAGLTLRAAGVLGAPTSTLAHSGQAAGALVVPAPYYWAAALSLVPAAVVVLALSGLWLLWRGLRRQEYRRLLDRQPGQAGAPGQPDIVADGDGDGDGGGRPAALALDGSTAPEPATPPERERKDRLLRIAGTWARARLTDQAGLVVGILLLVTAALLVAGCVAYALLGPTWLQQRANWLTTAGSFAMGALALWLITVGRNAYRSPGLRRTVGILWDVGTFWPRAVHPLAPPCYTERVIPDLLVRVSSLVPTDNDVVVISSHSQGTVIAAALVLQLDPEERRRVRLLTYGSPLQRVYARYFPAYFGPVALRRIGELLPPRPLGRQPVADAWLATGATWSWRNLFRPSDPIGGAVFFAYHISTEDNADVDWQLMDPRIDRLPGDPAWPPTYGHSDYFRDPAFTAACELLDALPLEPLAQTGS